MSSTPAAETVFSTNELLEQILLHLSIDDLFKTLQVSNTWQTVISRSKAIRRKMFLAPAAPPLIPTFNDTQVWAPEYAQRVHILDTFTYKYFIGTRRCQCGHRGPAQDYATLKVGLLRPSKVSDKIQEQLAEDRKRATEYFRRLHHPASNEFGRHHLQHDQL